MYGIGRKYEYKIVDEELDKIRKFIINKCKTLKEYEHIEIFNIIKKGGIQYIAYGIGSAKGYISSD